ncbi:hypothetical protein Tco_0625079 [Tanacetum coccineum]|uniref:Uncharacterized protein n=1 Tax=Tanacetum coccineum TaxID=301880 RepID=A0ABQ4WFV8_9ASTR
MSSNLRSRELLVCCKLRIPPSRSPSLREYGDQPISPPPRIGYGGNERGRVKDQNRRIQLYVISICAQYEQYKTKILTVLLHNNSQLHFTSHLLFSSLLHFTSQLHYASQLHFTTLHNFTSLRFTREDQYDMVPQCLGNMQEMQDPIHS